MDLGVKELSRGRQISIEVNEVFKILDLLGRIADTFQM